MSHSDVNPQAALKAVLQKAASDADFREQILANPDAADLDLPAGTTFAESGDEANPNAIILPPFSAVSDELTESELENVAGGVLDPMDPTRTNINFGCATPGGY